MSDIRIKYVSAGFAEHRTRSTIPNVGDHVQLAARGVFKVTSITHVEDGPYFVQVNIQPVPKGVLVKRDDNFGNF